MNTTLFLAQFWGWFFVIIAAVYLAGGKSFLDKLLKMHKDNGFVFVSGLVLLSLGLITVILHNIWAADWALIITLAGWASVIKGATRMAFPESTYKLTIDIFKNKIMLFKISVAIVGFLGVLLIYMSM